MPAGPPQTTSRSSTGPESISYARCDQLRVLSTGRLSSRRGMVAPDELRAVDRALRCVLDL